MTALKADAWSAIDDASEELVALSHHIHDHPELAHQEHHAAAVLSGALRRYGLRTECRAYGLPTAFVGRAGRRGPNVVVCCEYDALPGLGHACGHNVIAAIGVGAGLAAARVVDRVVGRMTVLGTPAEETGGGKITLAGRGAFAGAEAALLVHPGTVDIVQPPIHAAGTFDVEALGVASHAALAPDQGVNALDALALAYVNCSALRQHLRPTDKIHGVFGASGPPNVVPARATGTFMIRSADSRGLAELGRKVVGCFSAGAHATGARTTIRWRRPVYRELQPNQPLARAFAHNLAALGRIPIDPCLLPAWQAGSTDLGNVSHLLPTIHPKLAISPAGIPQHTPGFARYAVGLAADRAVVDGAKAVVATAIDIWTDPSLRHAMRQTSERRPARSLHASG